MTEESETNFKYIAVWNWGKFQGHLKSGKTQRPRIMTDAFIDSHPDYADLSPTERYTLEGCRRLIAGFGRNLENNRMWLVRALSVRPKDRHSVSQAVSKLLACGLLLLTNERDPFSKQLNRSEGREGSEGTQDDSPTAKDEHTGGMDLNAD